MPIKHAIWTVSDKPAPLALTRLATEQQLENMVVADPRIVSAEWMLIRRPEQRPLAGIRCSLGIREPIETLFVERRADNDKVVTSYLGDQDFQVAAFLVLAREIYETVRSEDS